MGRDAKRFGCVRRFYGFFARSLFGCRDMVDREQDVETTAGVERGKRFIGGRLGGILDHLTAADMAECLSGTSVKQAEVVVDLGLRRDGRAGVFGGVLLPDG